MSFEDRVRVPWWMLALGPLVMLVALPGPLIGWFGIAQRSAFTTTVTIAVLYAALGISTSTSILVVDGTLRTRSTTGIGPLQVRIGREDLLPLSAIRDVRLVRGAALREVRQRLTNGTLRAQMYGDRIGYVRGSLPGYVPGRPFALHLAVVGADGRPQERLLFTRDPEVLLRAIGHPLPPTTLERGPVPLPDGSLPPPDPLAAYHPRERKRRG